MAPKLKLSDPHRTGAAELVEELKAVHDSLCNMEQCDDPLQAIPPTLPATLASPALLQHRDKAVRLYSCCSVANCLRIFAPNAPYDTDQLRMIFGQFWKELKYLQDDKSPLYHLAYFLLESLATVRSAVLVWELGEEGEEQVEPLLMSLLTVCFDQLSMTVKGKQCKLLITELLQSVFEESSSTAVPWECVKYLCQQYEQPDTGPHTLALDVLKSCATRFQLPIAQHYCELIQSSLTDSQVDHSLRHFESLLCKLAKESAVLVVNVIPQLEQLLLSDITDQRQSAVKLAGQMLVGLGKSDGGDHLFTTWSGRRNDKSVAVRTVWMKSAVGLLSSSFFANLTLMQMYVEKMEDPDWTIRQRACEGLLELPTNALTADSPMIVDSVLERCKDKREEVRKVALKLACQLAVSNKTVLNGLFKLILFVSSDWSIREEYEMAIEELLLTISVAQMSSIVQQLEPSALSGFKSFVRSKSTNIKHMQAFCLLFDQRDSSSQAAAKLQQLIQMMAEKSKFPLEASASLGNIAKLGDRDEVMAAFKALKNPTTPGSAAKKLLAYLDAEHHNDSLPMIARRCSHVLFNLDFVRQLVDTADCKDLIAVVLAEFPTLFTNYGADLESIMSKSQFDSTQMAAFYRFVKSHPSDLKPTLIDNLFTLINDKECDRKRIKFAVLILAASGHGERIVDAIVDKLLPNDPSLHLNLQILISLSRHLADHPKLVSCLEVLKQLYSAIGNGINFKCDRYPVVDSILDVKARALILLLRLFRYIAINLTTTEDDIKLKWRREALNVFISAQSLPLDLTLIKAPYLGKVRWSATKGILQVIPSELKTMLSPAILPRILQIIDDPVDAVRSRFYMYISKLGKSSFWCALLALAAHDHNFQLRATVFVYNYNCRLRNRARQSANHGGGMILDLNTVWLC